MNVDKITKPSSLVARGVSDIDGSQLPARPQASSKATWGFLGFVRIILALVVMCNHIQTVNFGGVGGPWIVAKLASCDGFVAVLAFFLISGYSIAASLNREPTHFYARRFIRIWPVLALAVLMSLIPFWLFGPALKTRLPNIAHEPSWPVILANLLCLQALMSPFIDTLSPAWSLNCEAIYYCLAPFLRNQRLLYALAIGSVICYSGYSHNINSVFWNAEGGSAALCLAWAWLAGFMYCRSKELTTGAFVALAAPILFLGEADHDPQPVAMLACVSIAILVAHKVRLPYRVCRIGEYLGDVSYPLYLVHMPVIFVCYYLGVHAPAGLIAVAVAMAVLQVVDRPARRALSRLLLSSDRVKAAAAAQA